MRAVFVTVYVDGRNFDVEPNDSADAGETADNVEDGGVDDGANGSAADVDNGAEGDNNAATDDIGGNDDDDDNGVNQSDSESNSDANLKTGDRKKGAASAKAAAII
jgi:hypothetical protein